MMHDDEIPWSTDPGDYGAMPPDMGPPPDDDYHQPEPEPERGIVVPFVKPPEPEAPAKPAFDRATTRVDDLSLIHVNRLDPAQTVFAAWDAVVAANKPPWVFRRGDEILTIGEADDGAPRLKRCGNVDMNGVLLRVARWVKATDKGMTPVEPPNFAPADMVSTPSKKLPPIEAVIRAPLFDGKTGKMRLVNGHGYDAASRLYLSPPPDVLEPVVSMNPSDRMIERAKALIMDEWLGDFPFESQADKAHTMALYLLTLCRRGIKGPTPFHLAEAAERGTGKSLMMRVILVPCQAALPKSTTYAQTHEEVCKKITSLMRDGVTTVFYDNLTGEIDSPDLAAVLTETWWSDRILGGSVMGTFPNQAVWTGSGNNCRLSTDIMRRAIKILLNRYMEEPWKWTGAKIANLEQWTLDHRRQLLAAGLTLIQAWVAAGGKPSTHHLGSFEAWSNTMGGILTHIGMPGFLSNLETMHAHSDPKKMELKGFVLHWWNQIGAGKPHTAGTLATMVDDHGLLSTSLGSVNTDRGRTQRLARLLSENRNRVISDLKITAGSDHNQAVYSLEIVAGGRPPDRESVTPPAPKPWAGKEQGRDRYS